MEPLPEPMTPTAYARTYGGNKAFHNFANDYSHISDPNLRRRLALSEIDKVPFGLYHVRAVAVAGVGFFLDSYDIFAINLITTMLGVVFWQGTPEQATNGFGGNNGALPGSVNTALKASTSAGIVVGQVLFGWLADVFGRRRMYGIELGIIVVSTLNCALASASQSISSTGLLIFWRVMMGVGIGGDYPLSSVITSEFAPTRWRGGMMAAVFSMQGIGQLTCALVALVVTVAFKNEFLSANNVAGCNYACQVAADRSWRIIVGFGALPACFALYYRITIPETPRYTFDVAHDVEKADADIKAYMASKHEGNVDPVTHARMLRVASPSLSVPPASWLDMWSYFRKWKNLKVLLGTTLSWFFLDLAFYGVGLNNTVVLKAIGYSSGATLYHTLCNNAVGLIILACAGSLPGYWTAVFTIDTLGRKPLQLVGFLVLTVIFCILGFHIQGMTEQAQLALYVVAQFFFNWGPNTTTFIVPGECFPTRYRSTGHGLSAAMGKIGAIIAQLISIPLLANCTDNYSAAACEPWLGRLMQIFALFMLCGTFTSLLIPETKGVTLEELAGEAPTSYNAGRNGSISVDKASGWRRWNPFLGGQPAGFFYPRIGGVHYHQHYHQQSRDGGGGSSWGRRMFGGWAGTPRSPRMGIMTSPEIAATNGMVSGAGGLSPRMNGTSGAPSRQTSSRGRGAPGSSGGGASGTTGTGGEKLSAKSRGWRKERGSGTSAESNDNDYAFSAASGGDEMPMAPAGVLPGWGAGWGRIDRGGQQTAMENIRLQDVGSLLK